MVERTEKKEKKAEEKNKDREEEEITGNTPGAADTAEDNVKEAVADMADSKDRASKPWVSKSSKEEVKSNPSPLATPSPPTK